MKVTLVQTKLFWEDREKNLAHFDALISSIREETDLIVLPEMFSTGFTMDPEKNAEPADGPSVKWLIKAAAGKNAVITGSLSVKENGKFYNRLYWVTPKGEINTYNKRHLFRLAKEDHYYTPGSEKIIPKIGEWRICPMICYDLRFPVWSRNRFQKNNDHVNGIWDYDLLIYVANWPAVRSYAWKQLLIARAIENQCYVVGVNRVGKDGNDFEHEGDSVIIDPKGAVIKELKNGKEAVVTIDLDLRALQDFRNSFAPGMDADDFRLV